MQHTTQVLPQTEDLLLWGAVIICLAIVARIQYRAFGTTGRTRTSGRIASFFHLHEIVSKWQRNVCAVATAIPLSAAFVVVAIKPETFGSAFLRGVVLVATGDTDTTALFGDNLEYAPSALFPFAILIVSLLLFGGQIKVLFRRIEKGVVSVAGIADRAEGLAQTVSNELLSKHRYEEIVNTLEEKHGRKLALAEELERSTEVQRLSFQLLHLAKQDVPNLGLRGALLAIVDRYLYGVADSSTFKILHGPGEPEAISLARPMLKSRWFHGLANVVIFAIACGMYAGLVPMAYPEFTRMEIVWPSYGYMSALLQSILLVVLASVFPLFLGLLLLAGRTENVRETIVHRLSIVVAVVSLLSALVNFAFVLMQRVEFSLGKLVGTTTLRGDFQAFVGSPEFVYVLAHSLIPGFAILGMVLSSRSALLNSQGGAIAVGTGIVTVGHMACYAVFEEVAGVHWGYYWHQGLLAFVLTAVAFAIGKLFGSPSRDMTEQQLAESVGQSLGARG